MNKPVPYEGNEKYIFISYCHKNDERVYSYIQRLKDEGFRIWYDTGIDPGDEWPEVIASHLSECDACVAFMSEASMQSHNCRREINYAIVKQKPLIVVFLENAKLTYAMEMQLSTIQAIKAYDSSDEDVIKKLCLLPILKSSRGSSTKVKENVAVKSVETENVGAHANRENKTDDADTELTTLLSETDVPDKEPDIVCCLKRIKTGKKVYLDEKKTALTRNTPAELGLSDNKAVGRNHAWIYIEDGNVYISENNAINGTYVNDRQVQPNEKVRLNNNDTITLGDEGLSIVIYRKI